jgi:predicted MPP superfamily phosphohydrolase
MEALAPKQEKKLTRRKFLKLSGLSLLGFAVYVTEIARHELSIERRTIHIPRLADSFRGLRIVQVSDLHYAEYTEPSFIKLVVHEINRLKPDMVFLTGDFVSFEPLSYSYAANHAHYCAEILQGIQCPLRYAVLGNHDCIVGEARVTDALTTHNIPVLKNQSTPLERDGKRLWIAGLGDACERRADLDSAVPKAARTGNEPVILLAHEPDILPEVASYNVDLMFSGHTHGGQIRIPFLPPMNLPTLGQKYIEGLFQHGPTQLYVNRGIGAVGLPIRFRCPPEITVVTLA